MNRVLTRSLAQLRLCCSTSSPRLQRLSLVKNVPAYGSTPRKLFCSASSSNSGNNEDDNGETGGPYSQREKIKDRLLRLSMTSPDEFEPTVDPDDAEQLRWEKYKNCFPDQRLRTRHSMRLRSSYSNPQRRDDDYRRRNVQSARSQREDEEEEDEEESSFNEDLNSMRNQNRSRSNYNRYQEDSGRRYNNNNRYQEHLDRRYNNDNRYQEDPDRRYKGQFEDDYAPPPRQKDPPKGSRGGRVNPANNEIEDSVDYHKVMKDYDLEESDLPEEPRQSNPTRFVNEENRDAIKEAYLRKFKSGGDAEFKRNYHSYVPTRYLHGSVGTVSNFSADVALNLGNSSAGSERPSRATKMDRQSARNHQRSEKSTDNADPLVGEDEDPDTFGSLNAPPPPPVSLLDGDLDAIESKSLAEESVYDDEEEDDSNFRPQERTSFLKFTNKTVNLLQEKKLTEALDFFTEGMKEGGMRYRKSQLAYLYRCLISECAKAGHAKMAFKLHIQMRKRGLWVKPAVYTSLFNACANAPWIASECKIKMSYLREQMERRGYQPNLINYHSMIKAYGRCGDIESAFAIADEMIERRDKLVKPTSDTFCFLLQACISDTENGFRNALLTWDKMRRMKIRPLIYSYNLLLRATRECGVLIPEDIQRQVEQRRADRLALKASVSDPKDLEVVEAVTAKTVDPVVLQAKMVAMDSLTVNNLKRLEESVSLITSEAFDTPKVIRKDKKNAITLSDEALDVVELLNFGEYRLLMLGGMRGVLQQMMTDRIKPDHKTMVELLHLCRPTEIWDAVKLLDDFKIQPEVSFFNVLIRKLILSKKGAEVKNAVALMNDHRVSPDIFTWSALALNCDNWFAAKKLIDDMEASKFTLNTEVVGAFASQASRYLDPLYFVQLMKLMDKDEIPPTQRTLDQMEKFYHVARESIIQLEMGKPVTNEVMRRKLATEPDEFLQDYKVFRKHYSKWVRKAGIEIDSEDPWDEDYEARFPSKKKLSEDVDSSRQLGEPKD